MLITTILLTKAILLNIDFNMKILMSYFHRYRFMYLLGDMPLQKMVRLIFSTICSLNFLYSSPNTKLHLYHHFYTCLISV